jgi:hypothetical protein
VNIRRPSRFSCATIPGPLRGIASKQLLRLPVLLSIVAAVGCAGEIPKPVHGRAAGQWTFRLPKTQSPYASLGFGRGGSSQPAAAEPSALEPRATVASAAPLARVEPLAPHRTTRPKRSPSVALATPAPAAEPAPAPAAPAAETEGPARTAQPVELALNAAPTTPEEERGYAQRERQAQKQRDFRGGDAIVISASALVIILLIVILVLLLT